MVRDAIAAPVAALEVAFDDVESVRRACAAFREVYTHLRETIGTVIVGQDAVVDLTLTALFADGHVLLEGVPGLGKTLLVRTLADALTLSFARIQFTPDVMPADITGTSVVLEDPETGHRTFTFREGPVFHQLLLADEINRATPKSQAALLEAMQERSVSVAGETRGLERPFLVMATQNPIEQEGTYSLPEAQLDRFFFKILVPYTTRDEMNEIVTRTTRGAATDVSPVLDGQAIIRAQRLARHIIVAPPIQDFAVRLVLATDPRGPESDDEIRRLLAGGVSPRAAQALIKGAKVRALVDGRYSVAFRDIEAIAAPVLRHRLLRSFEADADGISADEIVEHLLETVPRDGDTGDDSG